MMFRACVVLGLVSAGVLTAVGPVAEAGGGTASVTAHELYSARVPSLCGHSPGRLVNGVLPGIPTQDGFVALAAAEGAKHQIALGKVRPGSGRDATAGFECNDGGVPWPEYVEVYGPGAQRIGGIDLAKVVPGEETFIHRLSVSGRVIHAEITGVGRHDDPDCCGSESALLSLRWNAKHKDISVTHKTIFSASPIAHRLAAAIRQHNRRKALRYASRSAVKRLLALRGHPLRAGKCYGELSPYWLSDAPNGYSRYCVLYQHYSQENVSFALFMRFVTWKRYKGLRLIFEGA
jgi:hypothetical protein